MQLLTVAGNGNGVAQEIRSWGNRNINHLYTLFVWGNFDGGNVTLEISPDNVQWFAVTGVSITVQTAINVEFRARYVRAVVAGGGAGVSLNAFLA